MDPLGQQSSLAGIYNQGRRAETQLKPITTALFLAVGMTFHFSKCFNREIHSAQMSGEMPSGLPVASAAEHGRLGVSDPEVVVCHRDTKSEAWPQL